MVISPRRAPCSSTVKGHLSSCWQQSVRLLRNMATSQLYFIVCHIDKKKIDSSTSFPTSSRFKRTRCAEQTYRAVPGYQGDMIPAEGWGLFRDSKKSDKPIRQRGSSQPSSISGEESHQRRTLMSDSHFCWTVTTSTTGPIPPHAGHGKQGAHTVGWAF
ncbi:hypothetical protein PoB_006105900 [Plakobranchus ocellatus]|uniref:Uncharacterized protein n=1 Tax=Plakobranchus ocellatus TaxID=259542 RepID=A0AAV4CRQ5_9GAST|nr:hypothetical protein PoB_006105900 [Plakobranchus ocellatus]